MRLLLFVFAIATNSLTESPAREQESYVRAVTDAQHRLTITGSDGRQSVVQKEFDKELDGQQTEFRAVAISPDRRTVGWIGVFTGCCSSSPYARKFEVFSNGVRRTIAVRIAVSTWVFLDGGTQLAWVREQLHGDRHPVYERIDITSGKALEIFSPEDPASPQVPAWVTAVRQQR